MCGAIGLLVYLAQALLAHQSKVGSDIQAHDALSGADVGSSLLATDMLFACLHGKHEATLAVHVGGSAHQSSGHLAHQGIGGAEITYVGTAIAHGYAQALCLAASDVGTPLAGRLQHTQGRCHGVDGKQSLVCMAHVVKSGKVLNDAVVVGLCHQHASNIVGFEQCLYGAHVCNALLGRNLDEVHAMELGIRLHHSHHGRVECLGDEHTVALLGGRHAHHHCLGGGGGTVVHGSVGDVHAGEVGHHALVLEDVLQCAL